jgi:hypothetical protein
MICMLLIALLCLLDCYLFSTFTFCSILFSIFLFTQLCKLWETELYIITTVHFHHELIITKQCTTGTVYIKTCTLDHFDIHTPNATTGHHHQSCLQTFVHTPHKFHIHAREHLATWRTSMWNSRLNYAYEDWTSEFNFHCDLNIWMRKWTYAPISDPLQMIFSSTCM